MIVALGLVVSGPPLSLVAEDRGRALMGVEPFTQALRLTGGAAAVWGDFNNDGDLDFLRQNASRTVLWNNVGGVFNEISPSYPIGASPGVGALAWADSDHDGHLDFIATGVSNSFRQATLLYRNRGDGSFALNLASGFVAVDAGAVAWGDFDNDGKPDLLLTGSTNRSTAGRNVTRIYRNSGDQTFSDVSAELPGVELSAVMCGDYDNDGRLDFALAGGTFGILRNISRIYHNNGDGTFTDIGAGLPGVLQGAVAWGDFDQDGDLDLLLAGNRSTPGSPRGFTAIYRNDGGNAFTDTGAALPALSKSTAAWGDFDNDGDLDFALAGLPDGSARGVTRVYVNDGTGRFGDLQAGLPGAFDGTLAWGDYDGDGDLDLLLSWDGGTYVLRNNISRQNNPPTVPRDLRATVLPHNNVVLSWSLATDPETRDNGLSYNLRVGRAPRASDVVHPHADTSTGALRLPHRGNAGSSGAWRLANLPPGEYFWSVQAIDPAFASSAFAPEAAFKVETPVDSTTNLPPTAEPQTHAGVEGISISILLTGSDPDGDPLTYIIASPPTNGVLRGTAPALTYIPNDMCYGADGFEFRTSDGLAVSQAQKVEISIEPVPDARFLPVRLLPTGGLEVQLQGEPGKRYIVERSTDLTSWSTLGELEPVQGRPNCDPVLYFIIGLEGERDFLRARLVE
ncbi:MAG: VCBS repeat-containing protein [Verrucomicrobia bacterium]|nr:VCBS repeat-containing protein [Verrucomicrobiota bacterium]